MLVRKLARCGNSLGAIIPKAIRDLLNWDEDTKLEYQPSDGGVLKLVPTTQAEHLDLLFTHEPEKK